MRAGVPVSWAWGVSGVPAHWYGGHYEQGSEAAYGPAGLQRILRCHSLSAPGGEQKWGQNWMELSQPASPGSLPRASELQCNGGVWGQVPALCELRDVL